MEQKMMSCRSKVVVMSLLLLVSSVIMFITFITIRLMF